MRPADCMKARRQNRYRERGPDPRNREGDMSKERRISEKDFQIAATEPGGAALSDLELTVESGKIGLPLGRREGKRRGSSGRIAIFPHPLHTLRIYIYII